MAYTYDNFLSKANQEGLIKQFTDDDLKIAQQNPEFGFSMLSVMKDANSAKTAEQKLLATEVANQLRSSYGSMSKGTGGGSFQYANENAYQKALADAMDTDNFQYDAEQDPVHDAYKKAMIREGERASANALARASARTGGVPSSYAVTAAQQAQNYYGSQIADNLVALEQNAYQRYLKDIDRKRTELDVIGGDRNDAYAKWLKEQELRTGEESAQAGRQTGTQTGTQTGALTDAQIKELQTFLGVEADGIWGPLSSKAAGGLTVEQAWKLYQQLLAKGEKPEEKPQNQPSRPQTIPDRDVVAVMKGDLPGGSSGNGDQLPAGTVNKTSADNRVLVGSKYMTWSEIFAGVQNGTLIEQYDPVTGKYSYVFAGKPGKGSDGATSLRIPAMYAANAMK